MLFLIASLLFLLIIDIFIKSSKIRIITYLLTLISFILTLTYEGYELVKQFIYVYSIEMLLSFDNLFVFIGILSSFKIESHLQKKYLSYGIIIAVLLRLGAILIGIKLIKIPYIMTIFGIFLFITGLKRLFAHSHNDQYKIIKIPGINKELTCMICIGFADIIFALDSIPAAISFTTNYKIIAGANIFSLCGMNTMMEFVLYISKKINLDKAVNIMLLLIGLKMIFL